MYKFYGRIQVVYDLLPTTEICDRNIQLYQAHNSAELFLERAIQDYENFKETDKDGQHVKAHYKDLLEFIWQIVTNKADPYGQKEKLEHLEGSLYCYCYALQYSPILK